MKILSVEKDYYDSMIHLYGVDETIVLNRKIKSSPSLSEVVSSISKELPPHEIYNELMMWIPTLKRKDIVENLSNDSKICKHGFNLKQSFRHRK